VPRYTALLDACTLVPIALADTLLRVAEKGLYRPLWSDRILTEAQEAIEEIHPGIDVQKRFTDMRDAFDDALVTGWEELESAISLPDNDDRHVVATAIRGGAQAIVTFNMKDFPATTLGRLGLQAIDPDTFLQDQLDLSPSTVLQVIREQAAHTRSPRLSSSQLAGVLSRAGVPGFADEIHRMPAPLNGATE
jgi:predicted nucleic acid-binding protein